MARGRKKKPVALKVLDGSVIGALEDFGVKGYGAPFIPEHLMDDARGCMECIRQSMPSQIYSTLDTYLLTAFAVAWATHKEAVIKVSAPNFQWVVTTEKGQHVNRWLQIMNKQAEVMTHLSARLGLDPLSRQQIKPPRENLVRSKFDGLTVRNELYDTSNVSPSLPEPDRVNPSS